jgi:uncharacterized protein (DUF2235 family)
VQFFNPIAGTHTAQTRKIDILCCYFRPVPRLSNGAQNKSRTDNTVSLRAKIHSWLRIPTRIWSKPAPRTRGALTHVVILDGTMSSLEAGSVSNAGLAYKLLCNVPANERLSLRYEQGVQWTGWRNARDVIEGRGINRQIRRSYGFIASRYQPGDRIFLIGYSRGAYAVRSLAGLIDQIGLLKQHYATERHIRDAYRHYELNPEGRAAQVFAKRYCHPEAPIEAICIWDCVKALGLRFPLLWRLTEQRHAFHNHHLGPRVKNGFHALALDETREAYQPVLWTSDADWQGTLEQMWFPGTHGDVGGQLGPLEAARPLANIPFVWLMSKAESCGLPLPQDWQSQFKQDANAPSVGSTRGWGKLFVLRKHRTVGMDSSETFHPSVETTRPRKRSIVGRWKTAG